LQCHLTIISSKLSSLALSMSAVVFGLDISSETGNSEYLLTFLSFLSIEFFSWSFTQQKSLKEGK
jgi:hypothetical protein